MAENLRYRKRYQLLFGALLSVVGASVRHEFSKQEDLTRMLAAIAEKVKAAREKEVSPSYSFAFNHYIGGTTQTSNVLLFFIGLSKFLKIE